MVPNLGNTNSKKLPTTFLEVQFLIWRRLRNMKTIAAPNPNIAPTTPNPEDPFVELADVAELGELIELAGLLELRELVELVEPSESSCTYTFIRSSFVVTL
ncbi:MAG: hypothetical protein ACXAB4_04740 [Candidatus Hodarchaeales archaeon]